MWYHGFGATCSAVSGVRQCLAFRKHGSLSWPSRAVEASAGAVTGIRTDSYKWSVPYTTPTDTNARIESGNRAR